MIIPQVVYDGDVCLERSRAVWPQAHVWITDGLGPTVCRYCRGRKP